MHPDKPATVPAYDALLRLSGTHPVLRWEHSADSFDGGWTYRTAVAWTSRRIPGYADDAAARRMYTGLGYRLAQQFSSRLLGVGDTA